MNIEIHPGTADVTLDNPKGAHRVSFGTPESSDKVYFKTNLRVLEYPKVIKGHPR